MKLELKDRIYKLTRNKTPLSCIIPSRDSKNKPLLYFDEDTGENRSLRYAANQRSPFEDEQDGNVLVTPIIFEDGMLRVPRTNPVLQEFLHFHPLNGKKFEEVNLQKDAQQELEVMNREVDALVEVKKMSIEQLENLGRVIFTRDVTTMTTAELKRDVLVFAKRNPEGFLRTVSDPRLKIQAKVQLLFDTKLLAYRNKKKDVYFNLEGNKKRMTTIPFGADPIEYLGDWFKTDEGVEVLSFLDSQL